MCDYRVLPDGGCGPLATGMAQGRLKYRTDIVEGREQAPVAVNRLFTGANIGKLLVRVSDDPGGRR